MQYLVKARVIKTALTVLMPLLFIAPNALADDKDREIAHLLSVLGHSDCQFVRNGKRYSGEEAAEHLAGKYDYAKGKIRSAEMFIEHIASKSYFSGKPYQVECEGEVAVDARPWLSGVLTQYRKQG